MEFHESLLEENYQGELPNLYVLRLKKEQILAA